MTNQEDKSEERGGKVLTTVVIPGCILLIFIFFLWGADKPPIPQPEPLKATWYEVRTARDSILENTVMPGNCFICHSVQVPDPDVIRPQFAHATIKLDHGVNNRCYNCHHIYDRDKLAGDGEKKVMFANTDKLCAKCHGIIYRDWLAGTHGRRAERWLLAEGEMAVNPTCTQCHDPHAPKFKYDSIAPAPTWPDKTIRHGREGREDNPASEYLTQTNKERF